MRLLHVTNSLAPSGAERHLANLLGPLDALGVENHLVTFFPGNGFEATVRRHVRRAELAVGRLRALPVAARMAREADAVHTQLAYGDILGRCAAAVARRPSFTTIQTSAWAASNRAALAMDPLRYNAFRLADRLTAPLGAHFFAVSTRAARAYIDDLGVPEARVEVLANSVDLEAFDPSRGPSREEARRALGVSPGAFLAVTLARLIPLKGLPDAIRAVSIVARERPVELLIAGDGSQRDELLGLVAALGAPVSLPGRQDPLLVLKAADLFVLSSYLEGMPVSLLEAMAMGLPCLCTDIPESVETGGDAVAYAPPRDPEALARALRALVDDPPRRAALGLRGRERSQRYAATAIARRYLAGIERVLAARGPGRAP